MLYRDIMRGVTREQAKSFMADYRERNRYFLTGNEWKKAVVASLANTINREFAHINITLGTADAVVFRMERKAE